MNDIGSFSYCGDGRVFQRLRHGGRLGGRVEAWYITAIDETTMTATLEYRGERITAPIGKRQLQAAWRGLASARMAEEDRHVHTRDCYDDPGPGHGPPTLVCDIP